MNISVLIGIMLINSMSRLLVFLLWLVLNDIVFVIWKVIKFIIIILMFGLLGLCFLSLIEILIRLLFL